MLAKCRRFEDAPIFFFFLHFNFSDVTFDRVERVARLWRSILV